MSEEVSLAPLQNGNVQITRTGLIFDEHTSYEDWERIGKSLVRLNGAIQWWIGDWINFNDVKYGQTYSQLSEITGMKVKTLQDYAYVSSQFESSIRIEDLPFSYHQAVASMSDEEKVELLTWAKENNKKRNELNAEVKRRKAQQPLPLPPGQYNVIYADPPWQYSNTGVIASAESHYSTMQFDDILTLPEAINLNIADNAILFLWVTSPFLVEGLQLCESWGFTYKSHMVWVKTNLKKPGVGFYVRGRHELLFIATRGSFTPINSHVAPPIGSVLEDDSIFSDDINEHSRKPERVYNIIETLYPDCNYIELFARSTREGWTSWGNEV